MTEELNASWEGEVSSELSTLSDEEDLEESRLGEPLLEIYTPVFQPGTRKVIAVVEFYELASDLKRQLFDAALRGWLIIILVTAIVFLLLFGIVRKGSRTIVRQQTELQTRVQELSNLPNRNVELHRRVQDASSKAAELNEKLLRKISAELHDGPAQGIGFALLRLDALKNQITSNVAGEAPDLDRIRTSLQEALQEIRHLCSGMALPELDNLSLEQSVRRVVRAHERRTETRVTVHLINLPQQVEASLKIAIYRFI